MKDLTSKIESAIAIAKESFAEMKWYSSFVFLATEMRLKFVTDDLDEKWFELGSETELLLLVARHCPMVYAAKISAVQEFSKIYSDQFIYEIIADFDEEDFCLEVEKVHSFFSWNTDAISPDKFSLNELFYATH